MSAIGQQHVGLIDGFPGFLVFLLVLVLYILFIGQSTRVHRSYSDMAHWGWQGWQDWLGSLRSTGMIGVGCSSCNLEGAMHETKGVRDGPDWIGPETQTTRNQNPVTPCLCV